MATVNPKVSSFEDLIEMAGTRGLKNYLIFLGTCFGSFITALHTFSYQFLGATPEYWCHIRQLENSSWTPDEIKDLAIPYEVSDQSKNNKNGCAMRDLNYDELSSMPFEKAKKEFEKGNYINSNQSLVCSTRDFPRDMLTIVSQWDLVCDRRALYSSTQIAIQTGMLFGAIILGCLIDRYGRIFIYRVCVVMFLLGGFGTAVSRTVGLFIFLKMFTAMLGQGFYISGFLIAIEMSNLKQRSCIGSLFLVPWAIGIMITPGIASLIGTWSYLEIALTFPGLLLLINFWILPESPRWLIVHQKYEEAEEILSDIARSNNMELPPKEEVINLMKSFNLGKVDIDDEKKSYFTGIKKLLGHGFSLVTDTKYRFRTLSIFFCWFSIAMVHYGITIISVVFRTNHYLDVFFGGLTELPSYLLLWPALLYLGRKKTLMILMFTCAVVLLMIVVVVASFTNNEFSAIKETLCVIGTFAVSAASHLVFVYTSELYPTKFRAMIIGEAHALRRLGTMLSPYISDLLFEVKPWASNAFFCLFSIASALVVMAFTETSDKLISEDDGKKAIEIPKVVINSYPEDESEIF